jgi:serine/threonine protein kinase
MGRELVATIAEALHYAHTGGLVHRDLEPANILLDASGRPCLADFGLALKDEDFGKVAAIAGSPPYMSPDQASGEGHRVDGRSDIFSLGIVFYELLTGRPPGFALGAPRHGNSPGTVLTASPFHRLRPQGGPAGEDHVERRSDGQATATARRRRIRAIPAPARPPSTAMCRVLGSGTAVVVTELVIELLTPTAAL